MANHLVLHTFGYFRSFSDLSSKTPQGSSLGVFTDLSSNQQLEPTLDWFSIRTNRLGAEKTRPDTLDVYINIYTHIYIYVIYIKGDAKNQCFLLATKNGDAFFHVHAVARIHPQVPVDMIQCGSLPRTDLGTTTKTTITSTTTEVGKAQIRHSKNGSHPKVQEDQLPWQQKVA